MDLGIGLPNAVPGAGGAELIEWARRAEARGFSSLGTIDRLAFDNYEPLVALGAAAAVTERIGLATTVLLAPLRPNAAELAKQALSLNALSDGRLTLGVGLGARGDDYEVSGLETKGRGRRLDEMLERIGEVWDSDRVGPALGGRPRLILGGHAEASLARAARFGAGWIAGATGPEEFARGSEAAKRAWSDAGRDDAPHLMALAYFSLGERAAADARENLGGYYAFLGEDVAGMIVDSAAKDADTVKRYMAAYEEVGCDELIFCPSASDPAQVDLLADAASL